MGRENVESQVLYLLSTGCPVGRENGRASEGRHVYGDAVLRGAFNVVFEEGVRIHFYISTEEHVS